jgi:hypothetical protein
MHQTILRATILMFFLQLKLTSNADANLLPPKSPIIGRWDITMNVSGKELPSWLEVNSSGNTRLIGEFVGLGGSARPISEVKFNDGKVSFSIPPQWETGGNLSFDAELRGDSLTGSMTLPDGKTYNCTAVRAPTLTVKEPIVWGKPIRLINGTDLKGWHPSGEKNQWIVEKGVLKSPTPGSNIITDSKFKNFKLHIEFRYPPNGNSGVYLRGRYEVQIADPGFEEPEKNGFGSVYGFLSPSDMVGKKPGEWQSYDITLTGRMVTIVANGKTIICNREIPGITGGALDSREGEPGPIMLQGDHEPIEYRNIILTPAR